MNTIIEAYLKASRIAKEPQELSEPIKDYYNSIYSNIITNLSNQSHPKLALCFTLQKLCEQVRISNDTDFLVYDISLSDFMCELNMLLLSRDAGQCQIERFIHHHFAEVNYSHNKNLKALFHKWHYNELKSQDAKGISDWNQFEDGLVFMLFFQIVFIILHELSHYDFSHLTKNDYILAIQTARNQLVQQDAVILLHDQKELAINALKKEEFFKKETDFLELLETDHFWKQLYEHKLSFYSQDKNIEEILCDTYALKNMLSMGYSVFPENMRPPLNFFQNKLPMLICHACYIGLQNLNVLSYIENTVDKFDIGTSSESLNILDYIPGAQGRKRCFVATIINLMTDGKPKDFANKEHTSFWLKLLKDTDNNYDKIMNVIFEQEDVSIVNIVQVVIVYLDKIISGYPESEWESRLRSELTKIKSL